MPFFSIVIPIFNKHDYVIRCLQSLYSSSFLDFEIICIDDGSYDGSYDVLLNFYILHPDIQILRNCTNKGVSYSRNKGIAISKGKYIFFLDADDYLDKNALLSYYNSLNRNSPDGCFIKILSDDGINQGILHSYSEIYDGMNLLHEFVKNDEFFLYACGAIWKQSFLSDNNLKFENLIIGEGGLFILSCLLKAKKIVCNDYPGYIYNHTSSSTNMRKDARQLTTIGQFKQIVYMIKSLDYYQDNRDIILFLEWYLKKHIGGIINLKQKDIDIFYSHMDNTERFIFKLIKGDYHGKHIQADPNTLEYLLSSKRVYLYGAGEKVLDAILYCNQYEIEIKKVFVTDKDANPNYVYGYPVYDFQSNLVDGLSTPFIITSSKKHFDDITDILKKSHIHNIAYII